MSRNLTMPNTIPTESKTVYTTRIVNKASQLPDSFPKPHSDSADAVFFEPEMLRAIEEVIGKQMKMHYALVSDASGEVMALGVLTTLRIDALSLAPKGFRRCVNALRHFIPNLLRYRVTCYGFPFWGATSPIALKETDDKTAIERSLLDALVAHARVQRSRVVMLHDFGPDATIFDSPPLDSPLKLHAAPSLADHLFPTGFTSLDTYLEALKPAFAQSLKEALNAFAQSPLKIEHFQGGPEVATWITPDVHALHETMASSDNMHFSFLTRELLLTMSNYCPDRVVWTLAFDGEQVVGYVFGLITESTYYSMYLGHDPGENAAYHLYTNLVLRNAEHALQRGVKELRLGTEVRLGTDYIDFKARLGCKQRPRRFWVGAPGLWLSTVIRIAAPLIFQPPKAPKADNVFKS